MQSSRRVLLIRVLAVLGVTVLALALRLRAVDRLPIDFDEDDYLAAARHYAASLRADDWDAVGDYDYNHEHPPLTKIVYGLSILRLPPGPEIPERPPTDPPARALPQLHFTLARLTAALFGTLQVLALALFDPLAGLFLGIHTWQIKYTSQIMLEPLPALTSAVMVLAYMRGRRCDRGRAAVWLALSAVMLGLTAAAKYTYCIAAIAAVVDWLWATRPARWQTEAARVQRLRGLWRWLAPVAGWGALAVAVFVLFNPRLWDDGPRRLWESVAYHAGYAQSAQVADAGYPIWQPMVWLSGPVPWHPGVFLFLLDLPISLLALAGARRLWRDPGRRVLALWLAIALAFLLWWTTKWPQYILILTAPLAAAAAEGFRGEVWLPLVGWLQRQRAGGEPGRAASATAPGHRLPVAGRRSVTGDTPKGPRREGGRQALPWLLPGLVVLGAITLFPLIFQLAMSLTDFSVVSIRDGISGGVWRAVWQGLTGQVRPVDFSIMRVFEQRPVDREVHFAGPTVLLELFSGLLTDVLFFNLMWAALSVAVQTALGVSAALLLHQRGVRFKGAWRAIFILPWAIPEYLGALIWFRLFEPSYGWLNMLLTGQGLAESPLQDSLGALFVLLAAAAWYGFPFMMLSATAALQQIPVEVYDAAALDGAGRWAQFYHLTGPLLWPLLAPAVLIRMIFAFNQFYLFFVMSPPGAMTTFSTLSYYVFNPTGRFGGWFAISAAINIFTVIVIGALVLWLGRVSKAAEGVTYA